MSCSFHLRPGTASWCLSIDMHQHILIWTKILLKPFSKSCQMFFRYLCITYLIAAKGELRWGVHTWAGGGAAGRTRAWCAMTTVTLSPFWCAARMRD